MQLNIEDPILAKLVSDLGKEIGELTTANIFMNQMLEKATLDNNSMHNLLASRDETIKAMNEKLSQNAGLIVELKSKIDTDYRKPNKGKKSRYSEKDKATISVD